MLSVISVSMLFEDKDLEKLRIYLNENLKNNII